MPRRFLNIASIVCLIACVVLMSLWVRSYYWLDEIGGHFTNRQFFVVRSEPSRLLIVVIEGPSDSPWSMDSRKYGADFQPDRPAPSVEWDPIVMNHFFLSKSWAPSFSYWLLVLTTGSLAMAFRLRRPWRFTLRGLFVVTTFLAIALGMIAWLDRAWIGK
jgi:hypothetical protein